MQTYAPPDVGKSEIGDLDGHIAGLLCYLFGVIPAMIFFFGEHKNPFVRFHALQVLLLFVAEMIFIFLLVILIIVTCGIGYFLIAILIVPRVFEIIALIQCVQKKYYGIPLIGDLALKWSAPKP